MKHQVAFLCPAPLTYCRTVWYGRESRRICAGTERHALVPMPKGAAAIARASRSNYTIRHSMFETRDSVAKFSPDGQEDFDELFEEACDLVKAVRMGIELDEAGCEEDDDIEDVLEEIEELMPEEVNVALGRNSYELLAGTWSLLFTSSSIARFHRGMSSLHKNFPSGRCENITLTINGVDGLGELVETISAFGGLKPQVRVNLSWDVKNGNRLSLMLDRLKLGPTSFYADSWKPLRAFTTLDITFINDRALICRGATGAFYFWKRV